jgi:ELWxxDGT repeat protein
MQNLVGDTLYFSATDGSTGDELWAHDTSNHSTWRVADIYSGSPASNPGDSMSILVGNTLYFSANDGSTGDELWAHDTSNHSTWQVVDVDPSTYGGISSSYPGDYMAVLMGDTIYFSAANAWGEELWAHDTSNHSTWRVADIYSGVTGSTPGYWMEILVGDTLYFSANDGSTGHELWAHQPSRIDENTNTGGAVTSWEINASLPSGVSFGTNNGTIYGTPTQLWTQTYNNIILDPGIGFGKNLKHNITILRNISIFHSLGFPVMLGTSRKRFIKDLSGINDSKERLGGTISSSLSAIMQGVQILRVHDVNEINQSIKVFNSLKF